MSDATRRADMKVVLVTPEIPGNTGSVGRTCVALGLELILIRPYGFEITEKSLRRAGLDYWRHIRLAEYDDWPTFLAARAPRRDQMFLFEDDGTGGTVYDPVYPADAYLIFGRETTGLQPEILHGMGDRTFRLPMPGQQVRSLNLANAVTAVAYQAMRPYFL